MATTLTADLEKLTGLTRTLFRRLKKPQWKPKKVSLQGPVVTYSAQSDPERALLLFPGAARICTYSEQLSYERPNIFSLTGVSQRASHDADRHVLFFAAPTDQAAREWVDAANKASLDAVLPDWTPLEAPVLAAWGHIPNLPVRALSDVLHRLNFKLSKDELDAAFVEKHARPPGKTVSVREFTAVLMHLAKSGPVVSNIFRKAGTTELTAGQLSVAMSCTEQQAATLLKEHGADACDRRLLLCLLFDESNSVIDPEKAALAHDMTRPLNEYLISSSHNTYLTGDQLKSESTAEMYRIVLEKGCRCVEIDLWDGDDGRPIVRHGHTMTSSELFENVLRVIAKHSFSHGYEYPVILSLENHLSYEQQIVAGGLMKDILGDLLLVPELVGREQDTLPSPESTRNKILIKAKTGRSVIKSTMGQSSAEYLIDSADLEDEESDVEEQSSTDGPKRQSKLPFSKPAKIKSSKTEPAMSKIAAAIANLVFLAGGNRKALMELWKQGVSGKSQYIATSCVSISEKKLAIVLGNAWFDLVREYNSHGLTRVYPKGTRVDSSNYIPTLAHYLGCQIVALNWQGEDTGLAINEARFLSNRGRGYVLAKSVVEPALPGTLQIEILSAFLLPTGQNTAKGSVKKDVVDSYCTLKLYDADFTDDEDFCSFKFESKVARSNGFAPVWQQTVQIPIKNRALSVLTLKVFDRDRTSEDDFVGYCPISTALMREGIRCCPLKSQEGDPYKIPGTSLRPSILCKIDWL